MKVWIVLALEGYILGIFKEETDAVMLEYKLRNEKAHVHIEEYFVQ